MQILNCRVTVADPRAESAKKETHSVPFPSGERWVGPLLFTLLCPQVMILVHFPEFVLLLPEGSGLV